MSKREWLGGWGLPAALLLLAAALRFWRLGDLALIGDESYYWLWSRHLDWSYFDHPAGVAVLTWLSTALGGGSELGIRWLNALLGVGCTALTFALGERLFDRRAGLVGAAGVAVGAPYLLTARFVYTDALHLFFLLLNLYCFWRLAEGAHQPKPTTAVAFGLSLALLFNTKYSAYLYALALSVAVLVDHRHLLAERRFGLALGIAALGLLPVVAWNAAHGWVSFRWQLRHAGLGLTGDSSLLGNLYHALAYLTWPLVALALPGLGLVRRPAERLLTLAALFLLLPVALSPANSPRNLSSGLVLLFLLAGQRWSAMRTRGGALSLPLPSFDGAQNAGGIERGLAVLLAALSVGAAAYGLGTVAELSGAADWPHSSIVPDIRRDAAGWREVGPALAAEPRPIFALDYSIASQIWYYSGRPAYTAWGQYRLWGIPRLEDVTIIGLDYLDDALIAERLRHLFREVEGPHLLWWEADVAKEIHLWRAEGLRIEREALLEQLDFLELLESARSK